ncbi:DUF4955 domain-containing protein [Bacteroides caecigallinarum]|nr:DUF4955 domain-containing protein [Bacteroides caecigallinarum]
MKKLFIYILSIFSVVAFYSCDDREDIRNDINDLISRLDKLQPELDKLNAYVANYQDLLNGQILILGYSVNEETGDYVLELSNGERMTIYSGKPSEPLPIVSIGEDGFWYYTMNGEETQPLVDSEGKQVSSKPENGMTPEFRINSEGMWEYRFGDGEWTGGIGMADPSLVDFSYSLFDEVVVNGSEALTLKWKNNGETMECNIPLYGGLSLAIDYNSENGPQVFSLNEKKIFSVKQEGVENIAIETIGWKIKIDEKELAIQAPSENKRNEAYTEDIIIKIFSKEGYCRLVTMKVKLLTTEMFNGAAQAWNDFVNQDPDNVLLDFSYAGYMHGEVAPPDVNIDFNNPQADNNGNKYYTANISGGAQNSATYKVYNIVDYGANGTDDVSDRAALIKILKEAMGAEEKCEDGDKTLRYTVRGNNANAIIYFPEGKYILRGGDENETVTTLRLTMGNLIFKGAGRDKTTIEMAKENDPANPEEMWSSPNMLEFKHNSGLSELCDVTGNAEKGTFSVEVSSTAGIKAGDWVCLSLKNNSPDLIAEELAPHSVTDLTAGANLDLNKTGVQVLDYHQVKSVSSNTVTFYEPIMRKVEAKWNWKIQKYPHYENVGVEDLKFLGHSKEDFKHHESAYDDGGFKPVQMIRLTNSWMRRVDFESVSEAHSFVNSANSSAYDIEISGNRGHSAIRSQASSRIFIGKVYDHSNGRIATDSGGQNLGDYKEGVGQYHGCGVSKQSMGAVIWNVRWGDDSCFESHATQPRATLIDNCTGGFVPWREGGDEVQLPNHLNDLTIWNMNATVVSYDSGWNGKWVWWSTNKWWKNLPPIIVGWSGQTITFNTEDTKQIKYYESLNAPVSPLSLYEAQFYKRKGYVPAWLNALK